MIDAPSLKTLKIIDNSSKICSVRNMPQLLKAEIKFKNGDSKFLGCLTSAKHLSLCLKPKLVKSLFFLLISVIKIVS